MPWNHRVRKRLYENIYGKTEEFYEIVECYYDTNEQAEKHEGDSCTVDAITPQGESIEALRWELEHMLKALDHPFIYDSEVIPCPLKKIVKED